MFQYNLFTIYGHISLYLINIYSVDDEKIVSSPSASEKVKTIIERKSKLNPRKKKDREKMEAQPCEQCRRWYADSPENIQETCRHRYHVLPPSTPEKFWNVDFFPPQDK